MGLMGWNYWRYWKGGVEEMMEKPLCLGTSEHSDTSLICKRCAFENECYLALNKKKN